MREQEPLEGVIAPVQLLDVQGRSMPIRTTSSLIAFAVGDRNAAWYSAARLMCDYMPSDWPRFVSTVTMIGSPCYGHGDYLRYAPER
ncbi:MAG: hypothetical protein DCC58_08010 [Chloroflexi bacterium]|nr:MAG: hypothetical protein DCC58_08010 [Chloroflexota bacterium]